MTAGEFRRFALRLPEATASSHMGHPDFRVGGRIFASLDYPSRGWGMVKLTSEQQELFVRTEPKAFMPAKGAWGRSGSTSVRLPAAGTAAVREALQLAWQNCSTKKPRNR